LREQADNVVKQDVSRWRFYRAECLVLLLLLLLAATVEVTQVDLIIADWLYQREGGTWSLRAGFWTQTVLHDGARMLVGSLMLLLLLAVMRHRARSWRHPLRGVEVVLIAIGISLMATSILKAVTNVSCPWGLLRYGGKHPYVPIFEIAQSAELGACFPAGHAGAGYSLFAFYFHGKYRPGSGKWRWLTFAISLGLVLDLAQQLRGAHFASHGLWTVIIVWSVTLAVFASFHSTLSKAQTGSALSG
jgi:membrane-associated PAP2 superfamily phosphatase